MSERKKRKPFQLKFDEDGLKAFAEAMNEDIANITRNLVVEAYEGVTERTPVDTGRLKASWNVGVGAPENDVPAPKSSTPVHSPDIAITQITGNEMVYVSTALGYAKAIEHGHSKKAPEGMARVTYDELKAKVNSIIQDSVPA